MNRENDSAAPMVSNNRLLQYNDLFPGKPPKVESILRSISRQSLVNMALVLIDYHHNNPREENVREFLHRFFYGDFTPLYRELLSLVERIERHYGRPIHVVYPPSSYKLFKYAYNKERIQSISSMPANWGEKFKIFTAYLIFNQEPYDRAISISSKYRLRPPAEREFIVSFVGSIADNDLINYRLSEEFISQFIKAQYLFKFLKHFPKASHLLEKLLHTFSCKSISEIFSLFPFILDPIGEPNRPIIDIEQYHFRDKVASFLDNFVLRTFHDVEDNLALRINPLVKLSIYRYQIVSAQFVLDKLYRGWYFLLRDINDSLAKNERVPELRSMYGIHFTEEFLVTELLKEIYPPEVLQLSGSYIRNFRNKDYSNGEPDYYIRNGNTILLFETKDTLLTKEAKESYDFEVLTNELRDKLVEKNNGKAKALKQLANSILSLRRCTAGYDQHVNTSACKILPILVLSEEVFSATGFNHLLNYWFLQELWNASEPNLCLRDGVEPLTVMTIDTLLFLHPYLKGHLLRLEDVVGDYAANYQTLPDKLEWSNRTETPFSTFSRNYCIQRFGLEPYKGRKIFIDGVEEL